MENYNSDGLVWWGNPGSSYEAELSGVKAEERDKSKPSISVACTPKLLLYTPQCHIDLDRPAFKDHSEGGHRSHSQIEQ